MVVTVTYETIRQWCRRFGPVYARRLRRRRGRLGDTWHLDEVFVTIQGRQQYLWRAVDEDGDVLDILVQSHRNRQAAVRFFRTLLKTQSPIPRRLITDQLRSYAAACRTVMPSVVHVTDQYANNRAEVSEWCRISFESGDTSCGRITTACSVPGHLPNGTRRRVPADRERRLTPPG